MGKKTQGKRRKHKMIFRIVLFNQGKPEIFSAEITQKNYLIAKKKLELTYKEIVSKRIIK